jgi:hypothetical protein
MNAKDIQNKIKGLYKDVEPDHFLVDDDRILSYEQRGLNFKERYNTDPEFKEKMQDAMASRDDDWRENVAKANRENPKFKRSEAYLESRKKLKADPEHRKMMAKRNKEMAKDPKWIEAHQRSRQVIKDHDSDWYKNIKKANQKRSKLQATEGTVEREKFMAGRRRMQADINWRINVAKIKGGFPVNTPWGILYISVNEASKDCANHGKHYSSKVIRSRCRDQAEGFSYATWEEFEKTLT